MKILQAISKHLDKHSIEHTTHGQHPDTNGYKWILITKHHTTIDYQTNQVLLQNHTIDQITEINIADHTNTQHTLELSDPNLFQKITQFIQQAPPRH